MNDDDERRTITRWIDIIQGFFEAAQSKSNQEKQKSSRKVQLYEY